MSFLPFPINYYPVITTAPINNIPIQTVTIQNCNIQGDLGGGIQLDLPLEEECKGCTCKKCNDFNEYATPNQPDKKSFICYGCRTVWA
jgi:hypothetical protein